jgi:hypothetical protein
VLLAVVLVAPQPALGQPPAGGPVMTVAPVEVISEQAPGERVMREVTIGNAGGADLEWRVFEGEPQPRPTRPATPVQAAGGSVAGANADGAGPGVLAPYRGYTGRPGWTVTPDVPPPPEGAVSLTHSGSPAIVAGSAVACTRDGGITTTRASYLRHFTLADFDVISAFGVRSVSFGVASARRVAGPITVNLFTLVDPDAPFDYHNFAPVGSAQAAVAAQRMAMVEVPVSGTVPAGATLVVELEVPAGPGGGFFIGAGPTGQSAPSYLRAEACGITSPAPTEALGSPDMQIVMGVTGIPEVASCRVPTGTSWVEASPGSATVAPGDELPVAVTFDSAARPPGEVLTADLCLLSNDPDQPSAFVPLTMRVEQVPNSLSAPEGIGAEGAAPVIEVTPDALAATLPTGGVTTAPLTIGNTGGDLLEWDFAGVHSAPPGEREQLLRDGVLLVPDSLADRVMAFDPQTGDLIDADFIPADPAADLGTPLHLILTPDQDGFWLSDQLRHVVNEYDLDGSWQGVFAPAGGPDPAVAQNLRGIHPAPGGGLLVTVAAGGNADSVAEFDAAGAFTGNFIDNGAGGLDSPWSIVFRDTDILVSANGGPGTILRYGPDGTPDGVLFSGIGFPEQMQELPGGNILVAQFTTIGGRTPGVWELSATGELVGVYTGVSGNRGVYELPNGNILTTNGSGVHEIDRGTALVETKISGVSARFITHVQRDTPDCDAPAELPWLGLTPASGTTAVGESSEVTVSLDAAGLAAGEHRALLCVDSNDPARPVVEVPVSLTVVDGGPSSCDRTLLGLHPGPLTVTEGVTCLAAGARVQGEVNVFDGAGLVATAAVIQGPVATFGATTVELSFTQVTGPIAVRGTTGTLTLGGNQVTGSVLLVDNITGQSPIVVSGNTISGSLFCTGNQPVPVPLGLPNTVVGGRKLGQCAQL